MSCYSGASFHLFKPVFSYGSLLDLILKSIFFPPYTDIMANSDDFNWTEVIERILLQNTPNPLPINELKKQVNL